MIARKWWVMLVLMGSLAAPVLAQDADEDLYDLANVAADAEVEESEEVLAEDERVHGEQWLDRERLEKIAGVWLAVQLLIMVLVVRDLRKKGGGWLAVCAWLLAILIASLLAGLVYFLCRKRIGKGD